MPVTDSPLRYPGGKTQFLPTVKQIIENNSLKGCTYLEPFAGGSGVAIGLLLEGVVSKVILNDRDRAIFAFWRQVLDHPTILCRKIRQTPLTIVEWRKQRAIYLDPKSKEMDLGFAAFFLNRTNRSGIIFSRPIGGLEQKNENYNMGCRFNREKLCKKVWAIHRQKEKIEFYGLDAIDFIGMFHQVPHSFWFIDPPYFIKGKALYQNYYEKEDHENLALRIINQLSSSKWILTYDVCDEIKHLYPNIHNKKITLTYSVQTKKKNEEYLFSKNLVID